MLRERLLSRGKAKWKSVKSPLYSEITWDRDVIHEPHN